MLTFTCLILFLFAFSPTMKAVIPGPTIRTSFEVLSVLTLLAFGNAFAPAALSRGRCVRWVFFLGCRLRSFGLFHTIPPNPIFAHRLPQKVTTTPNLQRKGHSIGFSQQHSPTMWIDLFGRHLGSHWWSIPPKY